MKKIILIIILSLLGQLVYTGTVKSMLNKTLRCLRLSESLEYLLLKAIEENKDITDLLKPGANVNIRAKYNNTPLHIAVKTNNLKAAKKLLELGADINSINDWEIAPLHVAAAKGHVQFVKTLISSDADINAKDDRDFTPLHYAVENNNIKAAKILIETGAGINDQDHAGETPLYKAIKENSDLKLVILLLKNGANPNIKTIGLQTKTPLHKAVQENRVDIVVILLESGAYVNAIDSNNETPLHDTFLNAQAAIKLIEAGAYVNMRNKYGWTPLHVAAMFNKLETARVLISLGADVNARTDNYDTPLHLSAKNNTVGVMRELLKSKANFYNKNRLGKTALEIAKEKHGQDSEVYELLQEAESRIKSIEKLKDTGFKKYQEHIANLFHQK